MRFLFLEPFFGGSHRDFAEGLVRHSRHDIHLVTLPARFWKWRMRGASLHFIREIPNLSDYDGVVTSGLLSLSDLKALAGPGFPPSLVYFHENQLTYPVAPGDRRDVHFGFTDITTALAADRVVFNSRTHLGAFFERLPSFIRAMPEYKPLWVIEAIRKKSGVMHPGCWFPPQDHTPRVPPDYPPLVIWNHRWEHDKNPDAFFTALSRVKRRGVDFRIAVLGESFQEAPPVFSGVRDGFGDLVVHFGYAPEREVYQSILRRGTVVVSTALQENFGIAVVEAVRFGCLPLLPRRLSYPEILPEDCHKDCLYSDMEDLVSRLVHVLTRPSAYEDLRKRLAEAMAVYSWDETIGGFDRMLSELAHSRRSLS